MTGFVSGELTWVRERDFLPLWTSFDKWVTREERCSLLTYYTINIQKKNPQLDFAFWSIRTNCGYIRQIITTGTTGYGFDLIYFHSSPVYWFVSLPILHIYLFGKIKIPETPFTFISFSKENKVNRRALSWLLPRKYYISELTIFSDCFKTKIGFL